MQWSRGGCGSWVQENNFDIYWSLCLLSMSEYLKIIMPTWLEAQSIVSDFVIELIK
jgi:hypothetical protein